MPWKAKVGLMIGECKDQRASLRTSYATGEQVADLHRTFGVTAKDTFVLSFVFNVKSDVEGNVARFEYLQFQSLTSFV